MLKVLNLFAYTGASTLAAAAAGAEVVHVDAARPVVSWARRNAELSHLADAPIRWIVDDARKFVQRELRTRQPVSRRDSGSTHVRTWSEVGALETGCGSSRPADRLRTLDARSRAFMLLTCHTPTIGPAELEAMLADAVFGHGDSGVVATTADSPDPRRTKPAQRRGGTLAGRMTPCRGRADAWMDVPCMSSMIHSLQNPRIKQALRLRDRRGRAQQSRIIIDGWRETCRALEGNIEPLELFVCEALLDAAQRSQLAAHAAARGVELTLRDPGSV